jgi:methylmalonyl-CoA/ethylmalonyl-CoA epimerase
MAAVNVTGLAQVALTVADLERGKAFYGERLGLSHLFDAPPGLAFFQAGDTRLMLSQGEAGEPDRRTILYYGVEDVAAAHQEMAGAGVEFEQAPRVIAQVEGRDVWLAVARDGVGNFAGLISG